MTMLFTSVIAATSVTQLATLLSPTRSETTLVRHRAEKAESEREQLSSRLDDERERCHVTSDELATCQASLSTVTQARDQLQLDMDQLQANMDKLQANRDQLQADMDKLQADMDKLQADRDELQANIDQLRLDRDKLRLERDQLQADSSQLKEDMDQLRVERDQLELNRDRLATDKDQLEACGEQLKVDRDRLVVDVDRMRVDRDEREAEIESLKLRLDERDEELKKCAETEARLSASLDEYKAEVADIVAKLDDSERVSRAERAVGEAERMRAEERSLELEERVDSLRSALSRAEEEKSALERDGAGREEEIQSKLREVEGRHSAKIESLLQERQQFDAEKCDLQKELSRLSSVISGNNKILLEYQTEVARLTKTSEQSLETCEELRTSLQQRDDEAKRIAERVSQLEELNSRLTTQGEESHSKLKAAEKNASESEERETVLKREFGEERKSLQQSLDCATALVDDKNREVETTRKEMELMRAEHVMTSSLRDSVAALENEKRLLQARVLHLESSSPAPAPFTPVVNGAESSGDTDFLNSVIVDQQQKIVKLKDKITELEHMMLNGDDDAVTYHGESDDPGRRMTPRLFCDICDVFDAHDTEDCPTQAMDESDQVGQGSTVRYQRGEERPYCDDCEVFGHWTSDCQEQEMF